jgi:hypothetical protein
MEFPFYIDVIGHGCYQHCKSLVGLIFTGDMQLRMIESLAFSESGLETLEIPSSVEVIGDFCFSKCSELEEVSFGSESHLKVLVGMFLRGVDSSISSFREYGPWFLMPVSRVAIGSDRSEFSANAPENNDNHRELNTIHSMRLRFQVRSRNSARTALPFVNPLNRFHLKVHHH